MILNIFYLQLIDILFIHTLSGCSDQARKHKQWSETRNSPGQLKPTSPATFDPSGNDAIPVKRCRGQCHRTGDNQLDGRCDWFLVFWEISTWAQVLQILPVVMRSAGVQVGGFHPDFLSSWKVLLLGYWAPSLLFPHCPEHITTLRFYLFKIFYLKLKHHKE